MTRQQKRRELVRKHFRRMDGREPHVYINKLTKEAVTLENRKYRRAVARAYAAGEWNRRNRESK
jgi:hypothetical protein